MLDIPLRIVMIVGSVRAGRFAPVVADWFQERLKLHGDLDVDVLDLAELDLPAALDGSGDAGMFAGRIEQADGYVVITPEYNHACPGPLKTAIDTAYGEWWAKPVAFVSYGGASGGLRAIEQLRLVFAELHAVTMRHTVSLTHVHDRFDESGLLRDPQGAEEAADTLLTQLRWWTTALRTARAAETYPG